MATKTTAVTEGLSSQGDDRSPEARETGLFPLANPTGQGVPIRVILRCELPASVVEQIASSFA